MMTPTSAKLFVNHGASQTRRRLKGFGHGVQRIETARNNKSVIIHTATGKHLRQLEAKFADVGFADSEAGINTPEDLVEVTRIFSTLAFIALGKNFGQSFQGIASSGCNPLPVAVQVTLSSADHFANSLSQSFDALGILRRQVQS